MLMAGDNGGMGSRLDASTGGETRKKRLGLAALPAGTAAGAVTPVLQEPLLLAHYMPWYATQDVSGSWGWHWTMNHFDPNRLLWEGQREAASHDSPLIGLYDSGDDQVLECQALLMKLSGLDGVIVDWYGTRELNDYAVLHRNTQRFIPWLKRAGLRFAICYEDQALKQLHPGDDLKQGTLDLQWAEKHCKGFDHGQMAEPAFPLLLQFVRQHSITPAP